MTFKVTVHVYRKRQCVNPENRVILQALNRIEKTLEAITSVEKGTYFLLHMVAVSSAEAKTIALTASQKLLANLVMDDIEIVKVEEGS